MTLVPGRSQPLGVPSPARVVEVGGRRVSFVSRGTGEPLILLHGGEAHKDQFSIFSPLLADGLWAIAYDQRDVGGSEASFEAYDTGDLADDCVGLMDALGIARAHVMGVSFGGAIALHVGRRHPDRVRSLVVAAAPRSFARPNPYVEHALSLRPAERAALMIDAGLSPEAQQDEDLMSIVHDLLNGRVTLPGSRRSEAIRSHDLSPEELAAVTVPTLLVYGELDPLVPPDEGEVIAAALPLAEMVVLQGARHGLSLEHRVELAALINGWVAHHREDA